MDPAGRLLFHWFGLSQMIFSVAIVAKPLWLLSAFDNGNRTRGAPRGSGWAQEWTSKPPEQLNPHSYPLSWRKNHTKNHAALQTLTHDPGRFFPGKAPSPEQEGPPDSFHDKMSTNIRKSRIGYLTGHRDSAHNYACTSRLRPWTDVGIPKEN